MGFAEISSRVERRWLVDLRSHSPDHRRVDEYFSHQSKLVIKKYGSYVTFYRDKTTQKAFYNHNETW